jgi:chorismate dehydratase
MEEASDGLELVFGEPGMLALWLERGDVDAALVPSIEFLRGVGQQAIRGPALVAKGRTMSLSLVSQVPLANVSRVAVDEFSRTPLIALRAVLDKLFDALPDLCVVKQRPLDTGNWRENFDAVLLTEDEGLVHARQGTRPGETCYDVGAMWLSLYSCPLVVSLWACNDEGLVRAIEPILVSSRDRGLKNLTAISESVARATSHDAEFLRQCFSTAWGYHLGPAEEDGLRVLENVACGYQLLQNHRTEKAVTA